MLIWHNELSILRRTCAGALDDGTVVIPSHVRVNTVTSGNTTTNISGHDSPFVF